MKKILSIICLSSFMALTAIAGEGDKLPAVTVKKLDGSKTNSNTFQNNGKPMIVEGMLMPIVGLFTGRIDFASMFYVLDKSKGIPVSLAEAKEKAISVIAYGQFINDIISFLIVAFVIFLIVKRANRLWSAEPADAEEPTTKNCPFCVSAIPIKATRCPQCTSQLQAA